MDHDEWNADELASSIESKLNRLPGLSSYCCIYKVPDYLRSRSEESYRPWVVSVGPFHHGDPRLQPLQEEKLRYLQSFRSRAKTKSLSHYIRAIRDQETVIREHYAEKIELSSDALAEMVLLDGAFIIELFSRSFSPQLVEENDKIYHKPRLIDDVVRDMKLLENQLPFYLLIMLYGFINEGIISTSSSSATSQLSSFIDLTCNFFSVPRVGTTMYRHFVDLLRTGYLPTLCPRQLSSVGDKCPSVKELHDAGVKFVKGKGKYLLEIKYHEGVLEIPQIHLEDSTESVFRNLVAFEQRHCYYESNVIDYIKMLDFLIDTPQDVEILAQCGIIKNCLGNNEEAAHVLNSLARQIIYANYNFYYSDICVRLNDYYNTPWHRYKAILHHKYLHHPWAAISVIYAIALLVFTVISTVVTVLANTQYL
ncbi:hypothetical protein Dimus_021761 [Dionaea muscipula]